MSKPTYYLEVKERDAEIFRVVAETPKRKAAEKMYKRWIKEYTVRLWEDNTLLADNEDEV